MKNITKLILGLMAPAFVLSACADVEYPEKSSACSIQKIYMNVQVPQIDESVIYQQVDGVVDDENHVVNFYVPYYLNDDLDVISDITKVFVIASVPTGAIITPGLGGLRDMSSPLDITVTASDGTTAKYTLIAEVRKSSAKSILSFSFTAGDETYSGIVKEDEKKVYYMASEAQLATIKANPAVPQIEVSPRAEVVTDITKPMDFSVNQTITVKAQDGTTCDWTIERTAPALLDYGFGYTKNCWTVNSDYLQITENTDYRSMCVTKNYVVLQDRYMEHKLYDKEACALVGTADQGEAEETMYINKDSEGNLVSVTASVWNGTLDVFYYADGETSAPKKLASVPILDADGRNDAGRKFNVAGSLKSGSAYLYTPMAKGKTYYRLHFEDGVYKDVKTVTVDRTDDAYTAFTYQPTVIPIDNTADSDVIIIDQFVIGNGVEGWVKLYGADGKCKASMADGVRANGDGLSADGKVFTFNGARYLMYIGLTGDYCTGHIRIYDITDLNDFSMAKTSDDFASFFVFQSDTMSSSTNGNSTGAVDFDIAADGSVCDVYMMLTNGGIMKCELTRIAL